MPPVEKHTQSSTERTGKDYRDVHEWLDRDPATKAARHDITKIHEFGKMIEEQYGQEGLQEYILHLHDDIKAKFTHLQEDLQKSLSETLAYFGIQ